MWKSVPRYVRREKMVNLFHFRPLFVYCLSFYNNVNVKKYLSRIWCWDLNSRPKSMSLPTRPLDRGKSYYNLLWGKGETKVVLLLTKFR